MDEEAGLHNNKASEIPVLTCGFFVKVHLLNPHAACCLNQIQGIVSFLFIYLFLVACCIQLLICTNE